MRSVRRMFPQLWLWPMDIPYFLLLNQQAIVACILRDKSITNGDINDHISSLLSALMKPCGVLKMRFDERNAHLAIGLFARYVLDLIGEPRKTHK